MPELKISIALCTFNGAAWLRDQLASIASQTHPPDELVVCDDRFQRRDDGYSPGVREPPRVSRC